ncbi:MlaE family ABC transporter permease [Pyxidicoccus sp. MSG2]|uniref:MlaE family ABC transporter permease n=1 Tax=Pyxidicoccus sp. MSG2 TaxID=2996790 RepID=UPI00226D5E33|nr:ABC transporter permease [Pyxidicoccus sp. MSG2]MCY1017837.1 ABC transporter permease [Pyxidicoccus sp. MSG2]
MTPEVEAGAAAPPEEEGLVARAKVRLASLGSLALMTGQVFSRAVRPPYDWKTLVYHTESLGVRSLPIALLTATFAGLVISLQFGYFLGRFGVQYTVGRVVVLTLFRELAPVLTALTVGARIGSGMAAELGAMTVTEQVDAIRALGADPLRKLVVPRVLACLLVMPVLTVFADVVGLVGGAVVVKLQYALPMDLFFQGALDAVLLEDFVSGVFKGAVFGVIIGLVGCFKGLTVEGGTEGVGRATTQTVAVTSVAVCLADFFITKLTLYL